MSAGRGPPRRAAARPARCPRAVLRPGVPVRPAPWRADGARPTRTAPAARSVRREPVPGP
ncbi:hypothetical protein ADK53_04910 [Streptomyces sp. WM6373]|nr:hypothetical protein ADK53_04910 [Streptomyces sp. WM6373]KOU75380.1 hypothetical protein ADK96_02925 [Streptomyces sp. IGB124]KOU83774.1 hypothetical protein ADK61_06275 [Streptomyces sp. XY66]KOU86398.1 hypothetical protein ADK93_20095 [Streptomyces sp. XY58]KOV06101.1 hypothetical protein ADK89_16425 [Streptomyces sp. XY37]KOV25250.1 hypothetical protein ADK90_06985 [Streptomyces sp. XY413]KOV48450.1 hypothetical protein ADK99_15745 [Streptomyces sp. MMG1064]KOV48769.1 hypothetical pro